MPLSVESITERTRLLEYLYEAYQRSVIVVGTRERSEGQDRIVAYPERGIDNVAASLAAPQQFRFSAVRGAASYGYLEVRESDIPGVYRLRIEPRGMQVVQIRTGNAPRMHPDGPTPDQRRLMQTIYDHFREHAEWPKYWDLQRKLHDMGVQEVAEALGPDFINSYRAADANYDRGGHGDDAILFLPGVCLCEGSEEDLANLVRVVRLGFERWHSVPDRNPKVCTEDLECLGISDLGIQRLIHLSVNELHIGFSQAGESSWCWTLSPEVRRYQGVESVEDYLDLRAGPTVMTGWSPQSDGTGAAATATALGAELTRLRTELEIAERGQLSMIADDQLRERCRDLLTAGAHYDRVVRESCVILEDRVRRSSGVEARGTSLMEQAFSPRNPRIRLSEHEQERRGAMELFRGTMAFFRNSAGHNVIDTYTRDDALRFAGYVDLLLGRLARATTAPDGGSGGETDGG